MKIKIYNIILFALSFLISLSAFPDIPNGAFNTVHVKAKNVDRYVDYLKNNREVFELVGADISGVCITKSGHQYPGELFVWNAFESIEAAYVGAQKYDPTIPNNQFSKLREVKYTATFKPIKEFDLKPGHERLWRMKLNDWRAFADMMTELNNCCPKSQLPFCVTRGGCSDERAGAPLAPPCHPARFPTQPEDTFRLLG